MDARDGTEVLFLLLLIGLAGVFVVAFTAPLVPVRRQVASSFPGVTVCLIAFNVLLFLATSQDGSLTETIARQWGLTPRSANLVTLVTSAFLHGSWMHLFTNMLGLGMFGPHVEEALGKVEYLLFYIGCGLAAGLLHVIISAFLLPAAAGMPMVGASGAIFGVLGLFAVRFYRARVRVFLVAPVPAGWAVGTFAFLQVVWGLLSLLDGGRNNNTANWAHIGGFLFGMLISVPLKMREDGKREYRLEDAESAVGAGRLDQAAAYYRLALTENGNDPFLHRALARVCAKMGQTEAAHRHYADSLRLMLRSNKTQPAADLYEEVGWTFKTFPLPATLLYRVGSACEESQRFPLALRAFSGVSRDYPQAPEAEMSLLRMGKIHLQKMEQPDSAASIFAEFLRLYPESEWRVHVEQLLQEAQRAHRPGPLPATQG